MSTALRALAQAGVAGLMPIVLAVADGSSAGTTAQASPGSPRATAAMRPDVGEPGAPARPVVRVILPGPCDTAVWGAAPSFTPAGAFVPTPGSPIGPRAARLAERLERGHATGAGRQAALR